MIKLVIPVLALSVLILACDSQQRQVPSPSRSQQTISQDPNSGGESDMDSMTSSKNATGVVQHNLEENPKQKIKAAAIMLEEAKRMLAAEGKYDCCIDHACNECALGHASCSCNKGLKSAKPVCSECYAGWQRGEGKDSRISANEVKVNWKRHSH